MPGGTSSQHEHLHDGDARFMKADGSQEQRPSASTVSSMPRFGIITGGEWHTSVIGGEVKTIGTAFS
jgi:hypothetical protein